MKHLFVPYTLALKLKDKGFDEPCLLVFHQKKLVGITNHESSGFMLPTISNAKLGSITVAAPLYQQVIDWFREKHEIRFKIEPTVKAQVDIFLYQFGSWKWVGKYKSDYEALTEAIQEALKLI